MLWLSSCAYKAIPQEDRILIDYYFTSDHFRHQQKTVGKAYTSFRESKTDIAIMEKLFDLESEKPERYLRKIWAMEVSGIPYFNLRYQDNPSLRLAKAFIRFNIAGDYCLISISDTDALELNRQSSALKYGFGILPQLLKQSGDAKTNFYDQEGVSHYIMIINTTIIDGIDNALGAQLKPKNFNHLLHSNYSKEEIKNMTVEQIYEIVKKLNAETK